MIEAIRQMAPSNFRDLIATALRRVELGDTGTIATTSLRDPMSNGRSVVSWHVIPLECMSCHGTENPSMVAFLDCSAPAPYDPEESENDVTWAGQHVVLPHFTELRDSEDNDEILSCLSSHS